MTRDYERVTAAMQADPLRVEGYSTDGPEWVAAQEQAALAWLLSVTESFHSASRAHAHSRRILVMLAGPRMPEEPTPEIIEVMKRGTAGVSYGHQCTNIYRALREHLTRPATKTVQVWRVEWSAKIMGGPWVPIAAHYPTETAARDQERLLQGIWCGSDPRCIRVTGPHDQEVPAS